MVGDVPGLVAVEVEGHDLEDPPAPALVPVAHVAELVHELRREAGLLADLACRCLLHRLVAVGVAFGQREHTLALLRTFERNDPRHLVAAYHHAAGGEFPLGAGPTHILSGLATPAPRVRAGSEHIACERLRVVNDELAAALRYHARALEHGQEAAGPLARRA